MKGECCKFSAILYHIVLILTIVGGLNWGLVGLFNYNLVEHLLSFSTLLPKVVYTLVGISSVILLVQSAKCCGSKSCKTDDNK